LQWSIIRQFRVLRRIIISSHYDKHKVHEDVKSCSIGSQFHWHDADTAQYIIAPFRIRQIPTERFQIRTATCGMVAHCEVQWKGSKLKSRCLWWICPFRLTSDLDPCWFLQWHGLVPVASYIHRTVFKEGFGLGFSLSGRREFFEFPRWKGRISRFSYWSARFFEFWQGALLRFTRKTRWSSGSEQILRWVLAFDIRMDNRCWMNCAMFSNVPRFCRILLGDLSSRPHVVDVYPNCMIIEQLSRHARLAFA